MSKFYLRKVTSGDVALWHAEGFNGYTHNLADAAVMDRETAESKRRADERNVLYAKAFVDRICDRHVCVEALEESAADETQATCYRSAAELTRVIGSYITPNYGSVGRLEISPVDPPTNAVRHNLGDDHWCWLVSEDQETHVIDHFYWMAGDDWLTVRATRWLR